MTGVNDLLKLAIQGHGGARRWEEILRFRAAAERYTNRTGAARHMLHLGTLADVHAFPPQCPENDSAQFGIIAAEDFSGLEHRHLAAEAQVRLSHLHPDY